MPRTVSAETRRALLKAIGERYRAGTKDVKLRILDEFVAVTGYHRKHAIRLFNEDPREGVAARRPRLRLYDEAVREALVVLWEASDRLCGKRLKAVLPILVPALENHGRLTLDATVRERVLSSARPSTLVAPGGDAERISLTKAIRRGCRRNDDAVVIWQYKRGAQPGCSHESG